MTGRFRNVWKRAMLRGTAFTGAYGKLRLLYSVEDPWNLTSAPEQYRFAATCSMLGTIAPRYGSILELGCGEGHQSVHLAALTDRLCGIDLSAKAVARARARCPDATFAVGELEAVDTLFAGEQFDLITACEVLYYSRDVAAVLQALQRRTSRLFVSNFLPRSQHMRQHFTGPGWRRLDDLAYEQTVWECFLWEANGVATPSGA